MKTSLPQLVHEVSACSRRLRADLNRYTHAWRLSDSEFLMLWLCSRSNDRGVPQNELAAAIGVSPAQMSGIVEKMRRGGYLESRRDESDRRRQYWRLAERGAQVFTEIDGGIRELCGAAEERLGVHTFEELVGWLTQLSTCFEGLHAESVNTSSNSTMRKSA